jgi:hypothetical protein
VPDLLSRHQNRHSLARDTALWQLVQDYCARLKAAGNDRWRGLPYSFAALDDGTPITSDMRRAACVLAVDDAQPFQAASTLQRTLRKAGVSRKGRRPGPDVTTLNFDAGAWQVAWLNFTIRLAARIIGAGRLGDLLRYATFLGWRSNYAAVLLDRPFELRHVDDRKAKNQ